MPNQVQRAPVTFEPCVVTLQDYLSAPMPFLIGIHSPNLFNLRSTAMEETVVVDLDRGTILSGGSNGAPTSPTAGGSAARCGLPWADQLEEAFALLRQTLRSPIEYESTPLITQLMQASSLNVYDFVLCMSWHLGRSSSVVYHQAHKIFV